MTQAELPPKFQAIDREIRAGNSAAAERALGQARAGADPNEAFLIELFEIQLAVLKKDDGPGLGLNRILGLMRRTPDNAYAREVYQRMSQLAYSSGSSSPSHSHPPPPMHTGDD